MELKMTWLDNADQTSTKDEKAAERVREAERKKELKAYQPTMQEIWFDGYMTHTGKVKPGIFTAKSSDAEKRKLKAVYDAVMTGEVGYGVEDLKKFSKAHALRLYLVLVESQRESTIKKMLKEKPANYHLIDDGIKLHCFVEDMKKETLIAVDTETTGLDVYRDRIVGISISLKQADKHVYIPFGHTTGEKQLDEKLVFELLTPALVDPEIKKVFHNAKYDIHMFIRHGVRIRGLYWDTQIAMSMLNENEPSKALKNLATKYGRHFGFEDKSATYEELFGRGGFENTPLGIGSIYAIKDTHLTLALQEWQESCFNARPDLLDIRKYFMDVEMPLLDVVVDMEQTGFTLDMEYVAELQESFSRDVADLAHELKQYFGDINVNSPSQLSDLLYNQWNMQKHLPYGTKPSTDAKVLKKLAPFNHGIAVLLKYREKTKLLSTYIEAMPKQLSPDGKIHASFRQDGTVTGRFSSQNPNLQNINGPMRKMFVAPEGQVILAGDFSQQEVRFLAHFTQEPSLVDAYMNGKDLYAASAAETFNKPIEECGDGSKYRKMMKFGVLSVMYGTGERTLAGQLGISEEEARAFINTFYEKNKRVKAWIESNVAAVRKDGFVTMMGGRKRRLPEAKSHDKWLRLKAERQSTNAIIQGSAAIQTKITMIKLHELCLRKGWKMLFSIHDEVAVLAPDTITREDVKEFENVMLDSFKLCVPNKTDIVIEKRWTDGNSIDEWFNKQGEA